MSRAKSEEKLPVLFDSAEQRPWVLNPDQFAMEKVSIETGDYTVDGIEHRLCIERKSLGDFVHTVIHDWIRFRKQLYRMAGYDVAIIVVEADWQDVWNRRYESEADPLAVVGKADAILLDHGVPCLFWGARELCIPRVERFILQAAKKLVGA